MESASSTQTANVGIENLNKLIMADISITDCSVNHSIESSLARLEEIVGEIEEAPPPLETLIDRYEEGMQLLKVCREKLDSAEKRIEMITRNARGETLLTPFSAASFSEG